MTKPLMRTIRVAALLATLTIQIVGAGGAAHAQPVDASSNGETITQTKERSGLAVELITRRRPLTLADSVDVSLRVESPDGWGVVALAEAAERDETLGGFVVLSRDVDGPVLLPDASTRRILRLALVPDLPGEATLPGLTVRAAPVGAGEEAGVSVRTDPITFEVRSALAEGDDAEPADLRGAVAPPDASGDEHALLKTTLLVIGLLSLAAVFVLWRRRGEAERIPTAAEEAEWAVVALVEAHDASKIDLERLIADLGDVLRRYIERTRSVAAPERTSEELLAEAAERPDFSDEQRRTLRSFLRRADRVKFARDLQAAQAALDAVREARAFIEADARPPAGAGSPSNTDRTAA